MIPEKYNASTLIDANLEAGRGAKTAIHFGDEKITYNDLFNRICAMGRALRALGVSREQRVLLILSDTPAFPVAFFGAMRIGAVPVPINPLYKASDYRFFLEDSFARVVITENAWRDKLSQALDDYDNEVKVIMSDGAASNANSMTELLAAHSGELAATGVHRDDMAFGL